MNGHVPKHTALDLMSVKTKKSISTGMLKLCPPDGNTLFPCSLFAIFSLLKSAFCDKVLMCVRNLWLQSIL